MAHVSPYFNRSLYPDVGGSAVDLQLDDVEPTDLEILLKALHDVCDPVNGTMTFLIAFTTGLV